METCSESSLNMGSEPGLETWIPNLDLNPGLNLRSEPGFEPAFNPVPNLGLRTRF